MSQHQTEPSALKVGDPAPDFALYSSDKELTRLSDMLGHPVVLLFFPLAFTNTCTRELCATRDDLSIYKDLDAKVFGISVDSLHSLNRYKQDHQLNFPLLSDFNKDTVRAYHAVYEEFGYGMRGVGKRAAFVIDQEGIIRYAEVLENAGLLPDFEGIQNTLRTLQPASTKK